jgi:ABC-type amino acid transport substrate-binding protein
MARLELSPARSDAAGDWDAQLAALIETMRKDGTLKRLSEKWYGIDLSR